MQKLLPVILVVVAILLFLNRPGRGGAAATPAAASVTLPEATIAASTPLFPGAEYDDAMGGTVSDETGKVVSRSMSWFLKTSTPVDQVVAFYRTQIPGARERSEGGETTFVYAPPGARSGESVTVTIRSGTLQITQETVP
jgi:hypothetical protein